MAEYNLDGDEYTLDLNGRRYRLTEEFRESVEEIAEGIYEENDYVETWWSVNEEGDPILNIETEGYIAPWNKLDQYRYQMAEVMDQQGGGQADTRDVSDINGGGGAASKPPRDDSGQDQPERPQREDSTFMVNHPQSPLVPQPEEDDINRMPMAPQPLPSHPVLTMWVPDEERRESWGAGRGLMPQVSNIEWNIQRRANEAIPNSTTLTMDDEGSVKEIPRVNNHSQWESLARYYGCEVIAQLKANDDPKDGQVKRKGDGWYEQKQASDGNVGAKWNL